MEDDFPPDSVEKIWRLTSAAPSEDMDSIKNVWFFLKHGEDLEQVWNFTV